MYRHTFILIVISLFAIIIQAQDDLSFREHLEEVGLEYQGFVSARQNFKMLDDPYNSKTYHLSELRYQLNVDYYLGDLQTKVKTDLLADSYTESLRMDLREMHIVYPISRWMDIKLGRQILTWGKGDFLFINDLFPKDFQSFFIGRELEYLKAPSDALKVNLYVKGWQFNIVYTPQFDPDIHPTGERLTFLDPSFGFRGPEDILPLVRRDEWFTHDEWAWRIQRNIKGFDFAVYGYHGYWKSPAGVDSESFAYIYPTMNALGTSIEGALLSGITTFETGVYLSDDREGSDPWINNSQWRWLLGYARDFKKDWKASVQWYQERWLQYDELEASSPVPNPDRGLSQVTLRISKMLDQQKWNLSLFTFYNITGNDYYLRPSVAYKLTDAWKIDLGANLFAGETRTTFWNQFNYNNNLYIGLKWSY